MVLGAKSLVNKRREKHRFAKSSASSRVKELTETSLKVRRNKRVGCERER